MTVYGVTGATGGLGSAAVQALLSRDIPAADIVAIVRNLDKAADLQAAGVTVRVADYGDEAALQAALSGVDKLLLVSSSEVGQRVPQHRNVIEAAKAAQVKLIAYTSILRADTSTLALATEHRETELLLASSGIPHVLLRNGWYWENYAQSAPAAIESGTLYGSAGEGKVSGASRRDYAAAAVAALVDSTDGAIYELGGNVALSYPQIAATIAEVSGKPVQYQNLPEAEYEAALVSAGLPAPVAGVLANSDTGASQGGLETTSTDLEKLIGHEATTLKAVLTAALG